jgi:outer membrane biosynthesis protein TonB
MSPFHSTMQRVPMKARFFSVLLATIALPALALELGPAGVPGAPGLVPPPEAVQSAAPPASTPPAPPPPATAPAPPSPPTAPETDRQAQAKKVPAACAKAKNIERCVARQEQKRKARAACKDKTKETRQQCINDYMNRRKK